MTSPLAELRADNGVTPLADDYKTIIHFLTVFFNMFFGYNQRKYKLKRDLKIMGDADWQTA